MSIKPLFYQIFVFLQCVGKGKAPSVLAVILRRTLQYPECLAVRWNGKSLNFASVTFAKNIGAVKSRKRIYEWRVL